MPQDPSFLLNLFGMILGAGAVYGAIRSDLKHIHEKIEALDKSLNKRIDDVWAAKPHDHA